MDTTTTADTRCSGRPPGSGRGASRAALAACARAVRGLVGATRRRARRGRDPPTLDPAPPGRQGGRARGRPPRAARTWAIRPVILAGGSWPPRTSAWCRSESTPPFLPTPRGTRSTVSAGCLRPSRDRARGAGPLRAKLSYTNIGFALAPAEFALRAPSSLRCGPRARGLDYQPPAGATPPRLLEETGERRLPGRSGGRPATVYRFSSGSLK